MSDSDKIMGFVPKEKYVLYTYYLILASAAIGLLVTVLSLIGVYLPLGGLAGLAGLVGLVFALVGYFGFKEEFSSLDQNHLFYLCVLFGVFFVIGLILNSALYAIAILHMLVMLIFNGAGVLLLFAGYNAHKHGRTMTLNKDSLMSEVQLAIKRA